MRPEPPVRDRFGETFVDEFAWLAQRDNPEVIDWLNAQNDRTEALTAHLAPLREQIFDEIKARTQETDLTVPWRKSGWWYFARTEEGQSYPRYCRRPDGSPPDDPVFEQLVLDQNALADEADTDYIALGIVEVSPDGTRLAYSVDTEGDEAYVLNIVGLDDERRALIDPIPNTSYGFAWAADSATFFFTTLDDAQRPYRVHRHAIGAGGEPALVHEESDERFFVDVGSSRRGDHVVIESSSAITSEVALIDAHQPTAEPSVVLARRQGVEYSVAHQGDHLYLLTNAGSPTGREDPPALAENFALWRTAMNGSRREWELVIAEQPDTRLDHVEGFANHLVVHLRKDGVTAIRLMDPLTGSTRDLATDEEVCTLAGSVNAEYDTDRYRFTYQSLVTPAMVIEENLSTGERTILKQQPVLGDFDPARYASGREWAVADDGTRVPISLVWRRGTEGAPAPCLMEGYGAYEYSLDPWFSVSRLSLLDRGVVYALAHVRGGGELGRHWYETGKFLDKPNSFSDFVACGRHLVEQGWTTHERLVARGRSAGGLLMGAVTNLAPDDFRAVVAEMPFVDPLNTMLDPTLPLTVTEWEEWGNPAEDPDVFRAMRAYSPYENVASRPYPALLVTGALNDPRVGYHEPAKFAARLQATVTNGHDGADGKPVLLRVEMGTGHGGPSGRYDSWREEAFALAFILDQMGLSQASPA